MYYTAPISSRVVPLPCVVFSTFIVAQASNSLQSNSSVAVDCWTVPQLVINLSSYCRRRIIIIAVVNILLLITLSLYCCCVIIIVVVHVLLIIILSSYDGCRPPSIHVDCWIVPQLVIKLSSYCRWCIIIIVVVNVLLFITLSLYCCCVIIIPSSRQLMLIVGCSHNESIPFPTPPRCRRSHVVVHRFRLVGRHPLLSSMRRGVANIHHDDINKNKYLINTITLTSAATAATTAQIK